MARFDEVQLALYGRAAGLESTYPISWPEPAQLFVKPADGKYLEVSIHSNSPAWEGMTDGKMDQGLFQINVVWPKNLGLIAPAGAVELVKAQFPKNLRLQQGTTRVNIYQEAWVGSPLPDADRVMLPITIPWMA